MNFNAHAGFEMKRLLRIALVFVALSYCAALSAESFDGKIPRPLPSHPGNVFLSDEQVLIPCPANARGSWRVVDIDGRQVASGSGEAGSLNLKSLEVGWYSISWENGEKSSFAVLAPLKAPVPRDSPVCLGTWFAGLYIRGQLGSIGDAASLAALSGAYGIRDATAWPWLTDKDGKFCVRGSRQAESLDKLLEAARAHGLKLLLYLEPGTPKAYSVPVGWGGKVSTKFPLDLRSYANFVRSVVAHCGQDVEWEAWNEPDGIGGAHIGSELTAAVKAFSLAARSVNPEAVIGLSSANAGNLPLTEAMDKNGYLDAIDVYNYHSHASAEEAARRRRMIDSFIGGRQVWATEYSYGSYHSMSHSSSLKQDELYRQAFDIPKIYARGLHDGNDRIYYFLLVSVSETADMQWGILDMSLQPRPAYVAFAAAGRLLAGAKPAGRICDLPAGAEGWMLNCRTDGLKKAVAVVWMNNDEKARWNPPSAAQAYDTWGRMFGSSQAIVLGRSPIYCVLEPSDLPKWRLESIAQRLETAPLASRTLCPVVADFRLPDCMKSSQGDFFIFSDKETLLKIDVYNFSDSALSGEWKADAPLGYDATILEQPAQIDGNGKRTLLVSLKANSTWDVNSAFAPKWLQLYGDYGMAGTSRAAIRFVNCPVDSKAFRTSAFANSSSSAKWVVAAAPGTVVKIEPDGDRLNFKVQTGSAPNKTVGLAWAAPVYRMPAAELPGKGAWGVALRISNYNAPRGAALSFNLLKGNKAVWSCVLPLDSVKAASAEGQMMVLPFGWFANLRYRVPDTEKAIAPESIVGCEIVTVAMPGTAVDFDVSGLSWMDGMPLEK